MAALIALFVGRVLGPSDLWDQTQPKTVSYTTDMLIHGGNHWFLPIERGEFPATKPPMYNWIAAPFVKLLGFNSEIAHRFPSVLAMALCWLILVRLGNSLDDQKPPALGWVAGIALACNGAIFKLGYLARPDMLLTLWLLLGWIAASTLLIDGDSMTHTRRRALVVSFWVCVILSALTKGPAAVILPVYGIVASRALSGSWRGAAALKFHWGLPLAIVIGGAWFLCVGFIDAEHLRQKLWFEEIYGRVTGLGPEGTKGGPLALLSDAWKPPAHFLMRFFPWSIPAVLGVWCVVRDRREAAKRPGLPLPFGTGWREGEAHRIKQWPLACTILILVVIGLFTLSAGKRPDYIAGAFPPGAILAAWWLLHARPQIASRWPWIVTGAAALAMAGAIIADQREIFSPSKGFGDRIRHFIDAASDRIAESPDPVVFVWAGETQLQAMLGHSQRDDRETLDEALTQSKPFWVLAGRRMNEPHDFEQWMIARRHSDAGVEVVVQSAHLPRAEGWPEQATLYRVTPAP